jgi:predicted RNA-binding Zn ribbon-like protein
MPVSSERVAQLQARIDQELRQTPELLAASRFSDYADSTFDETAALMKTANTHGDPAAAVTAVLDEVRRRRQAGDPVRLQHALMEFLTHHPAAAALGLRIPDLEERSPWLVKPGGG